MIIVRAFSSRMHCLLFSVACLVVATSLALSAHRADADTGDSDRLGFSLGAVEWITRNVVVGVPIPVCSRNYPNATQKAIQRWHDALDLKNQVFEWQSDPNACDTQGLSWDPVSGVVSLTVSRGRPDSMTKFFDAVGNSYTYYYGSVAADTRFPNLNLRCPLEIRKPDNTYLGGSLGCQGFDYMWYDVPENADLQTYYGRAEVVLNPSLRGADIDSTWTEPGSTNDVVHVITHELGHVLGLADYYCNRIGHPDHFAPSPASESDKKALMNSWNLRPPKWDNSRGWCDPLDGRPTPVDLDDYRTIYTPAKVTDVEAEALLDAVLLRWDQSDVFVESDFEIQRARGAEWLAIESVGANAESAVLAGQPGGAQRYRVVARTKALPSDPGNDHAYGAPSSPVSVHVRSLSLLLAGVTHNSATVRWTPLGTVQQYVAKSTKGANCDATGEEETITLSSSDAAEGASGAAGTTVTHPFSGLEPSTAYHLCVRAVRTIETGFVLRSGWVEASATTKPLPKLTVTVRPTTASCYTNGSVSIRWTVSDGTAPYAVKVGGVASSGGSKTVTCQARAGTQTVTVSATDSSTPQLSGSAAVTLTVTNPPVTPVTPPPPLTRVSLSPGRCYPGAEVSVSWQIRAGRSPTVTVNSATITGTSTSVTCRPMAGSQLISIKAQEGSRSTDHSRSVTVLAPPVPRSCSSSTEVGFATYRTSCGAVKVSDLLPVIAAANPAVCGVRHWRNGVWLGYALANGGQLVVPGSVDYTINPGNVLWLGSGTGCDATSSGAGGSSGLEPPECPDALKPASGPTVIDADATDCATVRGGGAAQISRGDYTLNLTLSAERDWWVLAPTSYHDNPGGAFLFVDLSSGGWVALDPADGAELARYAPVDAEGLSALLDAIVASVSAPAATE